jgi:hypothetical protein
VTKLGHHAHAGHAQAHLRPRLDIFFGSVDTQVWQLHAEGRLATQHVAAGGEAGDDVPATCDTSLTCARVSAKATGPCDITGAVGAVCGHGVPVRSLFCDMPTPEQYVFYLLQLQTLAQECPLGVKHVYIDLACRLKSSWARFQSSRQEDGDPDFLAACAHMRLLVNWMHGSSHNPSCQLQNNGRYQQGTGWTVGEQTEQLWALTKALGGLIRYMTHAHRRECIEALLALITEDKSWGMAAALQHRRKRMLAKQRESVVASVCVNARHTCLCTDAHWCVCVSDPGAALLLLRCFVHDLATAPLRIDSPAWVHILLAQVLSRRP